MDAGKSSSDYKILVLIFHLAIVLREKPHRRGKLELTLPYRCLWLSELSVIVHPLVQREHNNKVSVFGILTSLLKHNTRGQLSNLIAKYLFTSNSLCRPDIPFCQHIPIHSLTKILFYFFILFIFAANQRTNNLDCIYSHATKCNLDTKQTHLGFLLVRDLVIFDPVADNSCGANRNDLGQVYIRAAH